MHCVVSLSKTPYPHRVGGNRKRYQQSTNADQKSIETVFSIAICRPIGDKWQSKTLFHWRKMAIENTVSIDFRSTFLDSIGIFDCCLPGVLSSTTCRCWFSPGIHWKMSRHDWTIFDWGIKHQYNLTLSRHFYAKRFLHDLYILAFLEKFNHLIN